MTRKDENKPLVHVSGGSLSVHAMAVGDNARATVNNAAAELTAVGRGELAKRLSAVLDAVDEHGAGLADKNTVEALLRRIALEASHERPDKLTLKSFLSNLSDEVKSVAQIAVTVVPLVGTISSLFK